jgi:hypothetical protein
MAVSADTVRLVIAAILITPALIRLASDFNFIFIPLQPHVPNIILL